MSACGYMLCTTPRTGSTLLCALLAATGRAGVPESYFRAQDIDARVDDWGLRLQDGSFDFGEFVASVRNQGTTANGVFGVRMMWGTLTELVGALRAAGQTATDHQVLVRTFGELRFVYLRREDLVAQAVSRLRAEQTGVWHVRGAADASPSAAAARYDRVAIQGYLEEAVAHDDAWNRWFAEHGLSPLRLTYEDLVSGQDEVLRTLLGHIGVAPPAVPLQVSNRRMADSVSLEWCDRFRTEANMKRTGR